MGVVHDLRVLDALPLVLQLRAYAHLIHESGAADFNTFGDMTTFFDNRSAGWEFSFKD
jgi:hypothetical protein